MINPATGDAFVVPEADVALRARDGWTAESIEGQINRVSEAQREDEYGGVVGGIAATGAGVLRGVTGGLSDVAFSALGEGDTFRNLREVNPGLSTVGEIGGSVGGMFVPGTAASGIANLGTRIGAKGTVGAVVKAGVVEGGLTGLGTGVSELALSEEPLTLERATSVLSSNLLYGAAIGGGANLAGKVLEKGIVRAKGALDEFAAARSAAPDGAIADDLAGLDAAGLRTARESEVETLVKQQAAGKAGVVDEIKAYRATVDDANPWLVVTEGEPASLLNKSKKTLRNLMDDPEGLAKNPAAALKALRVQEQGISRALADADGIAKKLASQNQKLAKELSEELATLPDALDSVILPASAAKRYAAYADVRVPKGGTVTVNRAQAGEFLDALSTGKLKGSADEAFAKMPDVLQANRALQAKIEGLTVAKSELTSGRLAAIDAAKDGLMTGAAKRGVGEQMAGGAAYSTAASLVGAVPIVGPFLAPFVGAKAASLVGEQVFGRLGKATTEAAARTSKAVGAFLDVTRKITPVAPVLASKVLTAVRYAPERSERSEGKPTLASAFKARSEEIRSQTAFAADGSTVMRPQARQAMAAQLAPIRAVNPMMADRMETLAARRLEFLASKLPRRADLGTLQTGPDRYQPSDLEMRTFARYAAGVEDPGGIEERLAAGQITPEDAQVMREVYPERLAEITRQIIEQLPTLRASLPYPRRLALSILTGVAVDAAMHPRVLAVLQSQYSEEPGTEGGTQAPRAQASFGSVKSQEKATPAQERAS